MLLMPLQAGIRPVDANVEIVLLADADLRGVEDAFDAAFPADENIGVVGELAARNESGQVGLSRLPR